MDEKDRRKLVVGILILILFFINLIGEAMRDRTLRRWALTWLGVACAGIVALVFVFYVSVAHARDSGQWEGTDPAISQWYKTLMQPDNPSVSCCGVADGYWCDDIHVKNGVTFCTITDDRENEPLRRAPIPLGTEIEIPDRKLTWKDGNPTGHSILFLSSGRAVYCFVQGSGT